MYEYGTMINKDKHPRLVRKKRYKLQEDMTLDYPEKVAEFAFSFLKMDQMAEEYVYVIGTDTKMHPVGVCEVSHGTVDMCPASMRSVMIRLLLMGASRFVLIHNHPSGDPRPSEDDIQATEQAIKVGKMMDLPLVDHIVIGRDGYVTIGDGRSGYDHRVHPRQTNSSKG